MASMLTQYIYLAKGLIVGLATGAFIAFVIAGRRRMKLEQELALSRQECKHKEDEIARLLADDVRQEQDFVRLSEEVLDRRQKALEADNLKSISALLTPIRDEFEKFQRLVGESNSSNKAGNVALSDLISREMKRMQDIAEKVGGDARGLKAALLGNVNARGQWGEAVLEGILRASGLQKDIHYTTQVNITDDDGKGRPDFVIHQPDGTNVVIDSKALFPNYYKYIEVDSANDRKRALSEHIQSVRDTIAGLSRRHYETRVENSIEFVIMFFPLEGAYQLTISNEPKLITDALEKHVLPVGPASLIVMLTLIERMWRRNEQDRNTERILNAAQELADSIMTFGTDLDKIGKSLQDASAVYQSAISRLSSKDGRSHSVASAIANLESLHVKPAKAAAACMQPPPDTQ